MTEHPLPASTDPPGADTAPGVEASTSRVTPTMDLILETLGARHRLGERDWVFEKIHARALQQLAELGLIGFQSAVTPGWRAWLTDAGRAYVLDEQYTPPVLDDPHRLLAAALDAALGSARAGVDADAARAAADVTLPSPGKVVEQVYRDHDGMRPGRGECAGCGAPLGAATGTGSTWTDVAIAHDRHLWEKFIEHLAGGSPTTGRRVHERIHRPQTGDAECSACDWTGPMTTLAADDPRSFELYHQTPHPAVDL